MKAPAVKVTRRGFLTALKPRSIGGSEDAGVGQDREPLDAAPELPERRDGLELVLAQMNDLSGIEEP